MFAKIGTPEKISHVVNADEFIQSVECPKCKVKIESVKKKDSVTTISGAYIVLGKIQMTCSHCKESIEI